MKRSAMRCCALFATFITQKYYAPLREDPIGQEEEGQEEEEVALNAP